MKIAILDDGICEEQIGTNIQHINISNIREEPISTMSHGTICAKIIEKYGNVNELLDIKFLGYKKQGDIQDLLTALQCCLEYNVDYINLSCGVENYSLYSSEVKKLHSLIFELFSRGTKIFAAQSNNGRKTLPANFPEVISVEQRSFLKNLSHSIYRSSDVYIEGRHRIVLQEHYIYTQPQNSFACAYACALASKGMDVLTKNTKQFSIPFSFKGIKIPVIYIHQHIGMAELTHYLSFQFQKKGYSVSCVSDHIVANYLDIEHFTGRFFKLWLSKYAHESCADILIVLIEKQIDVPHNDAEISAAIDNKYKLKVGNQEWIFTNISDISEKLKVWLLGEDDVFYEDP